MTDKQARLTLLGLLLTGEASVEEVERCTATLDANPHDEDERTED